MFFSNLYLQYIRDSKEMNMLEGTQILYPDTIIILSLSCGRLA